jgi:hypothetical protein
MSASTITKVRNVAKAAIERIETDLRKAEETAGSLQLRYGMALAPLKDAAGKAFKAEAAKVSKRPYGTLNRWANAGRTALALGFTLDSKDVPPVYRIEPGFRFIRDARTPEAFEAGVADLQKWWNANKAKDAAAALKAAEKAKPSTSGSNGSNGGNGGTSNEDPASTVTIDPAAVNALRGEVKRWNNRAVYRGVDHTVLNAVRVETALWIREHQANPASIHELLAALSS